MALRRRLIGLWAALVTSALANGCGDGDGSVAPPPDPPRPTTVAVSPATAELAALGATVQLTAEVRDQRGQVMAGAVVTWSSGNASVATVDATGLVTAAANGTATVTATSGPVSGSANVTVEQVVRAVTVSPAADTLLALGDTVRLGAEARDGNGHAVTGAELSWASSDTLVAMVDSTGLVTAASNGVATVTATSGAASGGATVTVEQGVRAVTVSPAADTLLALGDTVRLAGEAADGNGRAVSGARFSWASSDTLIAMVDETGLVTAVANGLASVTATSGSVSDTARILVEQALAAVSVSPRSLAMVVGDTAYLVASAHDARGHEMPDTIEFAWSSSDATVVYVDATGHSRAGRVGATTVTATSGDKRGSTVVTVHSNDPADRHAVLTAGLPERPFAGLTVGGTEGSTNTVGTLRLGLDGHALPVVLGQGGTGRSVLVAGSRRGRGRVVAYSGQDFLSSGNRATLLGKAAADRFLANAVRWVGWQAGPAPLRILADNQRIADALSGQGLNGVDVVGRRGGHVRDWSVSALADADVAVVQTNEWGAAYLVEDFVAPLRAFVERGGGVVIAGSAQHWSWWIEQHHGPFTADALLRGTGISWNHDAIDEIASATTRFDVGAVAPASLWETYVGGGRVAPDRMMLLPGLFRTALELGRTEELDVAMGRLVRETPGLPTSSAIPEARLSAEVAETLGPREWPEPHPWAAEFPGLPAAGARRVDGAVTVDATRSEFPPDARRGERHLPLGFYAPPGALVTIEVPASHATGELRIAVGQLHDDLGRSYSAHPVWRRAPWLRREFPLAARQTGVTNAYGGLIALVVPADYAGTIPVTVRGAIPVAVYTAGESDPAEWFAALDAGAPQAVIQQRGGIQFVISAEKARGITDPGEVAAFWGGFQRRHAELAGGPRRAYESIWIFDPQVGAGYANAGPVRINYPLHGETWVLLPGTAEGREYIATLPDLGPQPHVHPPSAGYSPSAHGVDWWIFGHELGHQWQTDDWRGHGITEVGVNLFTMYTLNDHIYHGGDFNVYTERKSHGCAAPLDPAALASLRWSSADNCERLALYRQLISEFGWDSMKAVFHSYYDSSYPRSEYGGSLDGFAIRFSAIVKRDLVAFFRKWEYPMSESAAATIRSFGYEVWLPPGW